MPSPELPVGPPELGIVLSPGSRIEDGWLVRDLHAGPGLDGPPGILQGGFAAGVSVAAAQAADRYGAPLTGFRARLLAPTPLGVDLEIAVRPTDRVATYEVQTRHAGQVLVTSEVELAGHEVGARAGDLAELAQVPLPEPRPQEVFPTCWVCGAHPRHPLGLRLHPAPFTPGIEVLAWVADDVLGPSGALDPLIVAAVLDCPTQWAAYPAVRESGNAGGLLGGYEVRWYHDPPVMEPLRVVARHDGADGRKHRARSALVDEDGVIYALAAALMVAVPEIPHLPG